MGVLSKPKIMKTAIIFVSIAIALVNGKPQFGFPGPFHGPPGPPGPFYGLGPICPDEVCEGCADECTKECLVGPGPCLRENEVAVAKCVNKQSVTIGKCVAEQEVTVGKCLVDKRKALAKADECLACGDSCEAEEDEAVVDEK